MIELPHHILSSVAIEKLTPPDSESGLNDVLVTARLDLQSVACFGLVVAIPVQLYSS